MPIDMRVGASELCDECAGSASVGLVQHGHRASVLACAKSEDYACVCVRACASISEGELRGGVGGAAVESTRRYRRARAVAYACACLRAHTYMSVHVRAVAAAAAAATTRPLGALIARASRAIRAVTSAVGIARDTSLPAGGAQRKGGGRGIRYGVCRALVRAQRRLFWRPLRKAHSHKRAARTTKLSSSRELPHLAC